MEQEWRIYQSSRDVNKALIKQYKDGSVYVETVSASTTLSDTIRGWFEDIYDEMREERHGKLVKRKVIVFPLAREITLAKRKIHTKSWRTLSIIVRSDRFPSLYDLVEAHRKGTQISNREEKYRNLYQIYEELSKEENQELKAIRHSLSHPRKSLTSKKTIEILGSLFGDTKINLQIYKHAKVFRQKYEQLKNESETLLIQEILKILPSSPNFLNKYYMP